MAGARDRYEILDVIGHGATGVVHLARDRQRRCYVAAKVLDVAASDDLAKHRFLNEQQVALEHPHLLTPLDWYQTPDAAVLVMELADAGSVDDVLATNATLSPRFVEHVAAQALDGLGALHSGGILHRDIKPANLMLTRTDGDITLKLGDFGLSVVDGAARLTQDAGVVGTLGYVAPEVLAGGPDTARSDLWSLGHTLATLADRCDPPVPRRVGSVIERLTADEPNDRPASATEALRELDTAADDSTLVLPAVPDRVDSAVRSHRRQRRRRQVIATISGALVVGLAATTLAGVITREPAWLSLRRTNAAKRRVECLRFPPSTDGNYRSNVVPIERRRTFAPRARRGAFDALVALTDVTGDVDETDEDGTVPGPERQVGEFAVREPRDRAELTFTHEGRRWRVSVGAEGIRTTEEMVPSLLESFIVDLRPDGDSLAAGRDWTDLGSSFRHAPLWAVMSGDREVRAYADSTTLLDSLPGIPTTVLGRRAVVGRDSITWREHVGLLVVLEQPSGEVIRQIDDARLLVSERRELAESLRPCTSSQYESMPSELDRFFDIVLTNATGMEGLFLFTKDYGRDGPSQAPPRRLDDVGSEGVGIERPRGATSVRVWATRTDPGAAEWTGSGPTCAQRIPFPSGDDVPRHLEFSGCTKDLPAPADAPEPSLYCAPGSALFGFAPAQSPREQPVTLTLNGWITPIRCSEDPEYVAGSQGLLSSFHLRASLDFDALSCDPPAGTRSEAIGELIWGDGVTSPATIEVTFQDSARLSIEILAGPRYVGRAATTPITIAPFGSCEDEGVTGGVATWEGDLTFAPPAPNGG